LIDISDMLFKFLFQKSNSLFVFVCFSLQSAFIQSGRITKKQNKFSTVAYVGSEKKRKERRRDEEIEDEETERKTT